MHGRTVFTVHAVNVISFRSLSLSAQIVELCLRFGGLDEADNGKPEVVDMWRVSQGVTKQLALIKKGFGSIEIEGTLLQDPNRQGVGISKYMRTTLV